MIKLRFKYAKKGPCIWVSHLDILRLWQRTLQRVNADVAYSQGYNPHMQLTFALPIGVGVESSCEMVDIEFNSVDDMLKLSSDIAKTLPKGIEIISVEQPISKFPKFTKARYHCLVKNQAAIGNKVCVSQLLKSLNTQELNVDKTTKKGTTTINVIPHLFEVIINDEGDNISFNLVLSAGNEFNIKPELFLKSITNDEYFIPEIISIKRLEIIT
ncbi:MAG: TIGR03936 family radical SAM-associated protein [Clostridiales bacterium]|jgi:radical SAM-linked protein|nr:TIGR03936 family radical SAM-associated protein [Clostridiales bacterium]